MSQVYIDDADPSAIYSGDWHFSADSQASFHNTLHFTDSINSSATITFTGISAMVYGAVRAEETPQSSYIMDGSKPTVFQGTPQVSTQNGVLMYTSPNLRNGIHNLTITNLDDTLILDYFVIVSTGGVVLSTPTPFPFIPLTTSASSTTSTSRTSLRFTRYSISSGTLATLGTSSSSSNIPAATSAPESAIVRDDSSQKATIIGVVVAFAIVAMLIGYCLQLRRRRRKKENFWVYDTSHDSATALAVTHAATPRAPTSTPPPQMVEPQMVEQEPSYSLNYLMTDSEPPPYEVEYTEQSSSRGVSVVTASTSNMDVKRSG